MFYVQFHMGSWERFDPSPILDNKGVDFVKCSDSALWWYWVWISRMKCDAFGSSLLFRSRQSRRWSDLDKAMALVSH